MLGVNPRTVTRRIDEGKLGIVRVGRSVRIHPDDLEEFVDRNRCRVQNDVGLAGNQADGKAAHDGEAAPGPHVLVRPAQSETIEPAIGNPR